MIDKENNEYNNACRIRAGVFTGISFAARNCPWWRPFGISLIFHTRHWHLGSHSIHYSAEPYDGMCCLGSTKFMKPFISQQCASPSFPHCGRSHWPGPYPIAAGVTQYWIVFVISVPVGLEHISGYHEMAHYSVNKLATMIGLWSWLILDIKLV